MKLEHERSVACALAGICMEMKGKRLSLDRKYKSTETTLATPVQLAFSS